MLVALWWSFGCLIFFSLINDPYGSSQALKLLPLLSAENDLAIVVSTLEEFQTHMLSEKLPPESTPCEQRCLHLGYQIMLIIFVVPFYAER